MGASGPIMETRCIQISPPNGTSTDLHVQHAGLMRPNQASPHPRLVREHLRTERSSRLPSQTLLPPKFAWQHAARVGSR